MHLTTVEQVQQKLGISKNKLKPKRYIVLRDGATSKVAIQKYKMKYPILWRNKRKRQI